VRRFLSDFGIVILRFTSEEPPGRCGQTGFDSAVLLREEMANSGEEELGDEHGFQTEGMRRFDKGRQPYVARTAFNPGNLRLANAEAFAQFHLG
jgi:hypothetical protein